MARADTISMISMRQNKGTSSWEIRYLPKLSKAASLRTRPSHSGTWVSLHIVHTFLPPRPNDNTLPKRMPHQQRSLSGRMRVRYGQGRQKDSVSGWQASCKYPCPGNRTARLFFHLDSYTSGDGKDHGTAT